MSERPYEVLVEPERLHARPLATILIVSIIIIVVSAVVVKWWLPSPLHMSAGGLIGQLHRVGNLEETLLLTTTDTKQRRERQDVELNRYSWVDRQRGIVAIPIDRAMVIVAGRQKKR